MITLASSAAHPFCGLINNESEEAYLKTISLIDDKEMERVLKKAAEKGVGFEINMGDAMRMVKHDVVFKMYKMAKDCGCKFYLGSDAHHPQEMRDSFAIFEKSKIEEAQYWFSKCNVVGKKIIYFL